ncbi:MAG: penicillin-binding protein 2, partial [Subdoligranulum variabile]|nr:penicillin-binding protein 2 [Subdoligranulum variabile]
MSLRRLTALCCALAVLAAVILARVYWVGSDTAYAASAGRQTTQTTELPRARGNFLDRTGRPLTGTETTRYALCIPGDNSYSALLPCVPYQAQTLLYERRNTTSPFLIEIGQTAAPAGTLLLDEPRRTLPSPIAVHLLGYLDQENHGVTGLERAWDTVLAESCDQT